MIFKNNKIKNASIIILASLISMIISYNGIWNAYQTGDDSNAYKMVEWVDTNGQLESTKIMRLLTAVIGTHWVPITNIILYPTLRNDRLIHIVIINLFLLFLVSFTIGLFALKLKTSLWSALFASVWITTSQVLVLPVGSCWGASQFMTAFLTILSAFIIWKWANKKIFNSLNNKVELRFYLVFLFLLVLAILCKETAIRIIVLAFGMSSIILYMRGDLSYLKTMVLFVFLTTICIFAYLSIRYYFTQADIPLLRSSVTSNNYQRLSVISIPKNILTILLGSLSPINSYMIYVQAIEKKYIQVFLSILPAIILAIILLIGSFKHLSTNDRRNNLLIGFVFLLIISSMFPESLLGKVSEVYAMDSLWPLALLGAIVINKFGSKRGCRRFFIFFLATAFIMTNIISTKSKVKEILKTGIYAHMTRNRMIELTKEIPKGKKIAVYVNDRPKNAFSRFGNRGIYSGSGLYYKGRKHIWVAVKEGEKLDKEEEYALILEETKNYRLVISSLNE